MDFVSERRQDEIDAMFKGATKSKIVINKEAIPNIDKILVILDNTIQGQIALKYGTLLSKQHNAELSVLISDDFFEPFKLVIDSTVEKINEMVSKANKSAEDNKIDPIIEVILGKRIETTLQEFARTQKDDELVGERLVEKISQVDPDLIIAGVPLFHEKEDADDQSFGTYIKKLLKAAAIKSNFLLVNDKTTELPKSIISFVTVNQQPRSILALAYRMFSMATENMKVKIIGLVEDKIIETVARVELADEEDTEAALPIMKATEKLKSNMTELLKSLELEKDIPVKSLQTEVRTGTLSSVLKQVIAEFDETGLIMVRSVAESGDNLDHTATHVTEITLAANHPCFIVWD